MPELNKRSVSKKTRFEVFKRDSFKCQYCGKSAPDVILNCDHIKPISKGGNNGLMNLITACFDCNSGKSNRKLSDQSVIKKQKMQIDELNERREQLKLLQKYRESVKSIDQEKVSYLVSLIEDDLVGCIVSDLEINSIKSWVKKYQYKIIIESMEASAKQYLQINGEGYTSDSSVDKFFKMIPRICCIKESGAIQPNKEAYYIRGILKNRGLYFNQQEALSLINKTILENASLDSLKESARKSITYSCFSNALNLFLQEKGVA